MADFKLQMGLLKFEDIRTAIKDYFQNVKGINYQDGNNFSILVDLLSYLQEMMSYQLTQVSNNVYSRTCTNRKSAVENAFKLGYVPHRKIPNVITFRSNVENLQNIKCYGKRTGYPYRIVKQSESEGIYTYSAIQEESKTIIVPATNEDNQKILLPTNNISNSSINVAIENDSLEWKLFDIFDQIPKGDSRIFFISESIDYEFYTEVTFGNGIIGKKPTDNIQIDYYETFGKDGNDEIDLYYYNVDGYEIKISDQLIGGYTYLNCGKNHEPIESIQNNSSKYHSSRARLVTINDYNNYLSSIGFKNVSVSENTNGVNFFNVGNIYLSAVQEDLIIFKYQMDIVPMSDDVVANVLLAWRQPEVSDFNYINTISSAITGLDVPFINDKKIIGTDLIISSPTYMYIDVNINVESTLKGYLFNYNNLLQFRNKLHQFNYDNLFGFNSDFRLNIMDKQLFDISDRIKSIDYDVDYSIIYNLSNIIDKYILKLPNDFIATNDDYYNLDNNFFGKYYSKLDMPIDRHVIYGDLLKADNHLSGLSFNRQLYVSSGLVDTEENLLTGLVFDIEDNSILNEQSFPLYNDGTCYILSVEDTKSIILDRYTTSNSRSRYSIYVKTINGNDEKTFLIGNVNTIDNNYYIKFNDMANGTDIRWSELIVHSIYQTSYRTSFILKLRSTNKIGTQSGKTNISINSKYNLGKLFSNKDGYIDIKNNALGNLTTTLDTELNKRIIKNGDIELFSIVLNSSSKFEISDINVGGLNDLNLKNPIIKNNDIIISEYKVDNTNIGYLDGNNNDIIFYKYISNLQQSDFVDEIKTIESFMINGDNPILNSEQNFKLNLKPKYNIYNNVLKYCYDFDKKDGLYKIININKVTNK